MRGLFQDRTLWTPQRLNIMQNLGALSLPALSDSIPYIFYVQKGQPNTAIETVGNTNFEALDFTVELENNADFGEIASLQAGPAKNWTLFEYNIGSDQLEATDEIKVDLFGISSAGDILPLESYTSFSASEDLTRFNNQNIEYFFIEAEIKDPSNEAAIQFDQIASIINPCQSTLFLQMNYLSFMPIP